MSPRCLSIMMATLLLVGETGGLRAQQEPPQGTTASQSTEGDKDEKKDEKVESIFVGPTGIHIKMKDPPPSESQSSSTTPESTTSPGECPDKDDEHVKSVDVGLHGVHVHLKGDKPDADMRIHVGPPSIKSAILGSVGTVLVVLGVGAAALMGAALLGDVAWMVNVLKDSPTTTEHSSSDVPYLSLPVALLVPLASVHVVGLLAALCGGALMSVANVQDRHEKDR